MGFVYKEYVFQHTTEWKNKIKLVEIRKIEKLPRSHFKRKQDGNWETFKRYPVPNRTQWSKIRLIEDEEVTFGTGETKVGYYDHLFDPGDFN